MSQTVVFHKIYNKILEIFKENGYNIIVQNYVYINGVLQLTDKFPDVIVIKLQKGNDIGSIQATIGLEMNVKINNKEEEKDAINITWVGIEEKYRGKGLSYLLLIFCIMYIYSITQKYEYLTLDDDSDEAGKLEGNLYHKIGFKPVSNSGPERQLTYSELYYNSKTILENIQKYKNKFNKMRGGNRKTCKSRKTRKRRN